MASRNLLPLTLLTLALGLTARAVLAQQGGLVAAYAFSEGSGASVLDASGNGNTGVLSGPTWTTAGRFGSALVFDGTSALVRIDDAPSLALTTQMTLEAWVYPTASGDWRDVIYKANDLYFLSGSSPSAEVPATGGTFAESPLYAPAALPLDTWSHLATTYDGTTLSLYVNGVEVASRAQSGPIATSATPLTLGGDTLYGQFWAGRIDEVRLYNRALSASEIQADLATPISLPPPDSTPPSVSILLPSTGSTISHVTAISAAASDDVGIAAVEFILDGSSIGADTSSPYVIGLDTTVASNGSHSLTAVARDLGSNQTTAVPVSVTTLNPAFANDVVVPDITAATTIAFLPDGRMLVGELTETIWVLQPGSAQPDPEPFLQLDSSQLFGEQGLMDIALDPGFAQNGFYYVFYTQGFPGQGNLDTVSRFTASGNSTLTGSERVVWQDDVVANSEHHGGSLAFGPDGMLYISTGEHFNPPDSQRLDSYRGKILRINSDGTIPSDNPFFDAGGPNKDAVWALGLRNPFRISVDPVTGRLYIGDVGGNDALTAIEEVNLGIRGANYGWPLCEGPCAVAGVTSPVFSYPHVGRDASITGGFVYRGTRFPGEYQGSYFFADYVQNTIKRLIFDAAGSVGAVLPFWPADAAPDGPLVGDPVKLIEGPDGSLYYVDIGFNDQHVPNPAAIRRIRYTVGNQPPIAVASANPEQGVPPLAVSFSSTGSFDPEGAALTYVWTFGDGTSSTQANPSHLFATAGPYVARLSVSDGVNSTLSADLAITVGNPPDAVILMPANGTPFRAGDSIPFSGEASDPDGEALPAAAFSWTLLFHHDGHIHPAGGPFSNITGGTLEIPVTGHDFQGSTSYQIVLSVTDSTSLVSSSSVTVYPDKVNLTFDSAPSGLELEIDGIRKQTPFVLDEVKGFQHLIRAPDQVSGAGTHRFISWSDGGAQSHGIVTPDVDQAYLAEYVLNPLPVGLVAAYGFDEGSGSSVLDASENGNAGILSGPTWTTAGRFGGALEFDGVSALVEILDAPSLALTTQMTLEAWVYPTSLGDWRDVIYKANDLYFLSGSSPSAEVPATGGTFAPSPLYAPATLPVDTWSHLASTYDGATLRLYVNGAEVASRAQSGPIATSADPLTLGGDTLYGQYWAGLIDEVRLYNRALSASEIQADMNTSLADRDVDGFPDSQDDCPHWPNPDQADADGNGIGDLCECGDQNADGHVDVSDLVAIASAIFSPSLATPLCDTNADDLCNVLDIIGVNEKIFGAAAFCSRYPRP